jgi:hypothetical protein
MARGELPHSQRAASAPEYLRSAFQQEQWLHDVNDKLDFNQTLRAPPVKNSSSPGYILVPLLDTTVSRPIQRFRKIIFPVNQDGHCAAKDRAH